MEYLVKIKDINTGKYILDETDEFTNEENKAIFDQLRELEKIKKVETITIWDEVHKVTSYSIDSDSVPNVLMVEIDLQSDGW